MQFASVNCLSHILESCHYMNGMNHQSDCLNNNNNNYNIYSHELISCCSNVITTTSSNNGYKGCICCNVMSFIELLEMMI